MAQTSPNRGAKARQSIIRILRWFTPGLGVKRWLILILLGTSLIGIGVAVFTLDIYRTSPDTWWLPSLSWLSLRFLDRSLRVIIFGGLGLGLVAFGVWRLNRSLLAPYMRPGSPVVDTLAVYRRRGRGPRIAVIGGGHGLATLLRGLKEHTHNLTAIVTVADDGGSSGRLRDSTGILPPGDIRNCLAALSNDEALMTQLFQYRFSSGENGLDGHSFGNLFISALTEITGSFEQAVAESGRVLSVYGRVLPATLHDVKLVADLQDPLTDSKVRVKGESSIPATAGAVQRVWLEPNNPPAYPAAVNELLKADMIILGPGSLFTSILPNLLVRDLSAAVRNSKALKVYICNVATEPGETDHFTCGDHIRSLEEHVGRDIFDMVITTKKGTGQLPDGAEWVELDDGLDAEYPIYNAEIADQSAAGRHDSIKLAKKLIELYQERTGPLIA